VETVYLDTHVLVWLFSGDMDNFSPKAIDLIENRELLVSPMVLLELEYLHEIGRLNYKYLPKSNFKENNTTIRA
jgi:PIN domain nuclease of toxin-antitoxin system